MFWKRGVTNRFNEFVRLSYACQRVVEKPWKIKIICHTASSRSREWYWKIYCIWPQIFLWLQNYKDIDFLTRHRKSHNTVFFWSENKNHQNSKWQKMDVLLKMLMRNFWQQDWTDPCKLFCCRISGIISRESAFHWINQILCLYIMHLTKFLKKKWFKIII